MVKGSITAVIPVRAGSKRLPNKNILPFGNSNLLVHKIRQLKQVKNIDSIVVSSDSVEMLEMAKTEGVLIHKRAIEYADDKTKTFNEVIVNIISDIDSDLIMWTPCVCPLVSPQSYNRAIEKYFEFVEKKEENDSLVSVRLFKEYLWDEHRPLNYKLTGEHVLSQNLPDWYLITNGIYMASKELMMKNKYFLGENPYKFILSKKEAVDIDDAEDFEVAKALLAGSKLD